MSTEQNDTKASTPSPERLGSALARCDMKGHIIVRIGCCECGISDMDAIDYVLQLSEAVMVSHRLPNNGIVLTGREAKDPECVASAVKGTYE